MKNFIVKQYDEKLDKETTFVIGVVKDSYDVIKMMDTVFFEKFSTFSTEEGKHYNIFIDEQEIFSYSDFENINDYIDTCYEKAENTTLNIRAYDLAIHFLINLTVNTCLAKEIFK